MKIAVIGNYSDVKCGFSNYSEQTCIAMERAGHEVVRYDGTYSLVYARREACQESFLPPDADSFDVLHVVWHPATLNHYAGATWPKGPIMSLWNGCPQASCPFAEHADVKWSVLEEQTNDHRWAFYAIPDWIEDLPDINAEFTVGWSGIRGDGLGELTEVCARQGWQMNFSEKGVWLGLDDEVRRLARSHVNVCWYGGGNNDRSGAVAMCLASGRPQVVNHVPMFRHLGGQSELYWGDELEPTLLKVKADWDRRHMRYPTVVRKTFSWTEMLRLFEAGWADARARKGR